MDLLILREKRIGFSRPYSCLYIIFTRLLIFTIRTDKMTV